MKNSKTAEAVRRTKEELDVRWYEVLSILRAAQDRGCKWTMPGRWCGPEEIILATNNLSENEKKALQDYWDILLHDQFALSTP